MSWGIVWVSRSFRKGNLSQDGVYRGVFRARHPVVEGEGVF
jgi:hypothetical protein